MFQGDRGVDSGFRDWHQLYRRFTKEDVEGARLIAARIPYGNTSVNWSKYSKPWDVVFDNPGHGIAQLSTHHLPMELPKRPPAGSTPTLHSFKPEHFPESSNYSHSQLMTYKAGSKVSNPSLPATVKKEFRTIISDRSVVLCSPEV